MYKTICILATYVLLLAGTLQAQTASNNTSNHTNNSPLTNTHVEPTWESINQRGYPQWFSDAKLGIFIHWGLYSVPAYASKEGYAEWFYRGLMTQDSSRSHILAKTLTNTLENKQSSINELKKEICNNPLSYYSQLTQLWKAELWNPNQWAELFQQAGARYVLLVTKHHDGYCLWDSPYQPEWNSVATGPHRNIVEELTTAVVNHNMKMGFYYSLPEWTNPKHIWMQDNDRDIATYVDEYMIPQLKELVTRYKPEILFTDGEWNNSADEWHAKELISWYYNTVGENAIANDRWGNGGQHGFRTPEYSAGITMTDRPWAECRGMGRSFGLNRNEDLENYLSSKDLIQHFAKLVAAGGGITLNVGPSADGQIPMIQQERLRDLGEWLNINGEAIFETRPWATAMYQNHVVIVDRIDNEINFDWVRNSPDPRISYDNFTATWEGDITPKYTEKYTFTIEVDDNATIILDNDTLINYKKSAASGTESNAQTAQNYNKQSCERKLKQGQTYHLKVLYEEVNLEAKIILKWKSKSQPQTPVVANNGFKAEYKCLQPNICFTTKGKDLYAIMLDWPNNNIILQQIPTPNKDCKISILGVKKDLNWKYKNGELIIDTKDIHYNDLKDKFNTWTIKIENIL